MPKLRPTDLLTSSRLDFLELAGQGFAGRVFRHGKLAVKIAHPSPECRRRVCEEIALLTRLQDGRDQIPVPRLYAADEGRAALVRDFLAMPRLLDIVAQHRGRIPQPLLDLVWPTYQAVEAFRRRTRTVLDFTPANLYVDERRGRVMMADLGVRIAPYPFANLDRTELRAAFGAYLPWREKLDDPGRVRPFLFPPSGRFHIDVPVGRDRAARLLWVNRRLLKDLDVDLSEKALRRLGSFSTQADKGRHSLPASLYQDSPPEMAHPARGDGRALYVGQIPGGPYGRYELMLKGCGPTPLRWEGNPFHEDGLVSFPRTLWETTVADELARLGFETPQVLAILSTAQTTIDNTRLEWPATAALRMSATHFRFAHLLRWEKDPDALRAIGRQIGRTILRPDFDPGRLTHLRALVLNFTRNLAFHTGRTDALNIHGFNPTPGNVRADGFFIDYSTVRFMRHYLPDMKHPEPKWQVRGHPRYWRGYCRKMVQVFARAGILPEDRARRLRDQVHDLYGRCYLDGYLAGLFTFLGLDPPPTCDMLGLTTARLLVEKTRLLRQMRADERLELAFWRQTVPAPLYDLEGRSPDLVTAWIANDSEPWRALRSAYDGHLTPQATSIVRSWLATLSRVITPGDLRPRRWEQIFRPFVEAERLGRLCYRGSRPDAFGRWRREIGRGWG